jgi:hypothetical protein
MIDRNAIHEFARYYVDGGISIIPVRLDGSKAPALESWTEYHHRLATPQELERWFLCSDHGIGMVCGVVSGGLEVIDFDDGSLFEPWFQLVPDIACGLTYIRTPSDGWHVVYRCDEIGGSRKIAMDPTREKKTLIETKGEGGMVVAWGSPASTHPTGKPYLKEAGLHPWFPWKITPQQRRELWAAARKFNKDDKLVQSAKASLSPKPSRKMNTMERDVAIQRAKKYVAKMEPAISGCNGHGRAFNVAAVLTSVNKFGLSEQDAYDIFMEVYNPKCQPPWSEKEALHKIRSATEKVGRS